MGNDDVNAKDTSSICDVPTYLNYNIHLKYYFFNLYILKNTNRISLHQLYAYLIFDL